MSKKIIKRFALLLLVFSLIFSSVQVSFAQETETERIIYSQVFLEKVKEYIDNVCWGEWIPEQEEYKNTSLSGIEVIHYKGLKIYSEDKEMVVFGLSDIWCTVSKETIDGYVFENPSFYGNKNNKTGLCVYKNETVYSIAQAVEEGVVSAEELAEIIPYTVKENETTPTLTIKITTAPTELIEPTEKVPMPTIVEPTDKGDGYQGENKTEPTEAPDNTTETAATDPDETNKITQPTATNPKHTHKIKIKDEKLSTYFRKGYTGDKVCKTCGATVKKGKDTTKVKLKTPKVNVSGKGKKLFVKCKKVKDATGFQIKYYKIKGKVVTKNYNAKKTIKKSITDSKFTVRAVKARAFIKKNGKIAYSNWNTVEIVQAVIC